MKRLYMLIYFSSGLTVNAKLMPVNRQTSGNMFIFQQDSAPACTVLVRQRSCYAKRHPAYKINDRRILSDDYKICAVIMQQCVYQTKIRDVDELRQRLLNVCHNIEQEFVRPRWPYDMRPSAEKYMCVIVIH